jgi:hypothetical protein
MGDIKMKSIHSDDVVSKLSDLCEKQSAIISGIGKLLNLLSHNDEDQESSTGNEDEPIKKRGRPAKEIVQVEEPMKKRGRPAKNDSEVLHEKTDINSMKFSEVLLYISKKANKPMKVAGFVEYALKLGYRSEAKDFANISYQYLHSLYKKSKLSKNDNNEYFLS